jgi:hypothetical protein
LAGHIFGSNGACVATRRIPLANLINASYRFVNRQVGEAGSASIFLQLLLKLWIGVNDPINGFLESLKPSNFHRSTGANVHALAGFGQAIPILTGQLGRHLITQGSPETTNGTAEFVHEMNYNCAVYKCKKR